MSHNEKLYELRKYSRSIGGPEPTLPMLEFLDSNKGDMPSAERALFDDVMASLGKILKDVERTFNL